jgi:hypothetical protein
MHFPPTRDLSNSAVGLRHSLENRCVSQTPSASAANKIRTNALRGAMNISFTSDEENGSERYYDTSKSKTAKAQSRTLDPLIIGSRPTSSKHQNRFLRRKDLSLMDEPHISSARGGAGRSKSLGKRSFDDVLSLINQSQHQMSSLIHNKRLGD